MTNKRDRWFWTCVIACLMDLGVGVMFPQQAQQWFWAALMAGCIAMFFYLGDPDDPKADK